MAQSVEQIRSSYPDATVEVWAEIEISGGSFPQKLSDEHRIGLHPVNRMVWTPVGSQPVA